MKPTRDEIGAIWASMRVFADAMRSAEGLRAEQERMTERGTVDRIEAEGADFKARIHSAFERIAREDSNGSHRIVDGVGTIEEVHARVLEVVEPLLGQRILDRSAAPRVTKQKTEGDA